MSALPPKADIRWSVRDVGFVPKADIVKNLQESTAGLRVKVVGVFPDNSHDPIIYPVAATVNAKPETMRYLAFLRSAATKAMFEGYGFLMLVKPTS